MFDFKVSTHAHYDDACRKFALAHNMEDIANKAGMRAQTLRNKLNPDQPHQLTVTEVLTLTDVTEDATLVDGLLAQIQCLPCVPINEVANEKLPLYVMKATAEVGQLAAGAISTEPMTASSKRGLLQNVNNGIRCLTLAAIAVQARIQANPALSSTVDAISGIGASLGMS
ncbi:phage regulatory CII family protein [Pantoea sp. At-9b]|uniref:phage regulatory CII family protein n=1 Tax=Pantoea sp. (strain At-9b) TaxID=592316 RepID=UPI0001B3E82B|nr:phage regulatory CII family protein [Pantoea sp. At-9b]ADU69573.1 regulatory CII family protein [Pantoea sp. At-9b]